MRSIRHTGTPLSTLRDAGFNTVWMDDSAPVEVLNDAARLGMWIVPSIVPPGALASGRSLEGQLTSSGTFGRSVARFLTRDPIHDAVLAWDLGSNLGADRFPAAAGSLATFAVPTRAAQFSETFGMVIRAILADCGAKISSSVRTAGRS